MMRKRDRRHVHFGTTNTNQAVRTYMAAADEMVIFKSLTEQTCKCVRSSTSIQLILIQQVAIIQTNICTRLINLHCFTV